MNFIRAFSVLLFFALFLNGCKKKEADVPRPSGTPVVTDSIYFAVDEIMHTLYYWSDRITEVDNKIYKHPTTMMHDMRYNELDRWSEVYERDVIDDFMSGESYGYGISPMYDMSGNLAVTSVYTTTQAYAMGLRRGDVIVELNNTSVQRITDWSFLFNPALGQELKLLVSQNGAFTTLNLTATSIVADKVLHSSVVDRGAHRVGYVVYESFTTHSQDDLLATMANFKDKGVTDLVIDLRYNGGGEIDVLLEWANVVLPISASGKGFMNMVHNDKFKKENISLDLDVSSNSLDLNEVYVITSSHTASASEALVSCFSSYINVHQIGSRTHGKPTGMYVLEYGDWYLLPIAFEYTNADGEGGFFSGIAPEMYVSDDVTKDWGDDSEACFAEALYHIKHGQYSTASVAINLKSSMNDLFPRTDFGLFTKKSFDR